MNNIEERWVKVSYDEEARAFYIYWNPIRPHDEVRTQEVEAQVIMDTDKNGKTSGIEILIYKWKGEERRYRARKKREKEEAEKNGD